MTSHTPDDGFHEIQLNGKQLVFLFMAATVVSVVIFLLGVLVGRDVRAERGAATDATIPDVPFAEGTTATTAPPAATGSDPRMAPPPPAADELSYFNRLEKPQSTTEELKTASTPPRAPSSPPPPAPVRTTPAAAQAPPPAQPAPVAQAQPPPSEKPATGGAKGGYVVQLAALNSRGEAEAMVERLTAKGYEAYVQPPANGAPAIFRVRVGNYPTRRDAETVAAKLEKEGQFKPWVAPR